MAVYGAWPGVSGLPGYLGPFCYAALPRYAAALHRAAGITNPPYDPVRIATSLGVRVQTVPTYDGTRGVLVPLRDGAYRILVRAAETPDAQRFTVAHELVELGLQVGCPALVERSYHDAGAGRAKERFCEAGAAEILMPLACVRAELAARGVGIAALPTLSALFSASLHATLRRMVEAAPTPCAGLMLFDRGCAAPLQCGPDVPQASSRGHAASMAVAAGSRLSVRGACSGGGLVVTAPAGAAIPADSVLARCHRERVVLCAVEHLALGPLRGRFRVEAICPGHGARRHVYALLHPC